MAFRIFEDDADGYDTYFEWVDGNAEKVKLVDPTLDGALGLEEEGRIHTFACGRPIYPDFIATKLISNRQKIVGDFYQAVDPGGLLVSAKFKNIVEKLEPSKHQFFPVEILSEQKSFLQEMFLMIICNRLNTADANATTMVLLDNWAWVEPEGTTQEESKIVLCTEKIGNHHLWVKNI